jgi:hypothetical protein
VNKSPFPDRRLANTVTWHLNPPSDINMRIPDRLKKSVFYLGIEAGEGEHKKTAY